MAGRARDRVEVFFLPATGVVERGYTTHSKRVTERVSLFPAWANKVEQPFSNRRRRAELPLFGWKPYRPRNIDLSRFVEAHRAADESAPSVEHPVVPISAELVAWRRAAARLPRELCDAITTRYTAAESHWPILLFASGAQAHDSLAAAVDLMHSSPALAFAAVPLLQADGTQWLGPWLRLNQRDALGAVGWPNTKAMAKLMRRIRGDAIDGRTLEALRATVGDREAQKRLAHLPGEITSPDLLLLACDRRLRELASPALLTEAAALPVDTQAALARALGDAAGRLRAFYERKGPRVFRAASAAIDWHRQARKAQSALAGLPMDDDALGEPPIPGSETLGIVPISNPLDLWEEGQSQRNCAFDSARTLALGAKKPRGFFYRVLSGPDESRDRATLMIKRTGSRWKVSEIKAKANAPATQRALARVNAWLASHGQEILPHIATRAPDPAAPRRQPQPPWPEEEQLHEPRIGWLGHGDIPHRDEQEPPLAGAPPPWLDAEELDGASSDREAPPTATEATYSRVASRALLTVLNNSRDPKATRGALLLLRELDLTDEGVRGRVEEGLARFIEGAHGVERTEAEELLRGAG